jgi:uncharacterized protein (DUF849 family)
MEKLIITAALIGNVTTRERNPNPPITPKEIAESAIECYQAGAAVCHVHVRDPITQAPSNDFELFEEVVERVRGKCDMIINLSTALGGRLTFDTERKIWDTSGLKTPEARVEHVIRLKPEICSLDIGTMNFGNNGFINLVPIVERMSSLVREAGVKPELEVFDVGQIGLANNLIQKGLVNAPPLFQLCLGISGGMNASLKDFLFMRDSLPEKALWSAFGVGAAHFPIAAAVIMAGGNARVGFEDNLYLSRGVLAKSSAQMVRKVVELANHLDRDVANADEARKILAV